LCNFAGLYYIHLNDEQTALQYFLDGIQIADKLNDSKMNGMLYNNIGLGFAGRGDWKNAKELFQQAVLTVTQENNEEYDQKIISYLSNFAESCLQTGEMQEAKEALEFCTSMKNEELYYQIRIGCEWASYYAKTNQKEKCIQEVNKLFNLKIEEYNNKFFICDMIENISMSMLSIEEYEWAKKSIDMLETLVEDSPPVIRQRFECAKIRYLEAIHENADESYKAYYTINKEMSEIDHKVRLQSILSIIQLHETTQERDEIKQEKAVLENIMQLDELTGLYNRRYFNKMTSKPKTYKDGRYVGIVMIDLDYFKQYNDQYGHLRGDDVLRCIGTILKQHATEEMYPCRYGGDEFICFCQHVTLEEIETYVKNICNSIREKRFVFDGNLENKYITFSVGYTIDEVDKNLSVDSLLLQADKALYKAKAMGRNTYYKYQNLL
ncbi:MAG: tetratricopeptide repeat-containing diguanylate cyclase, partial [Longicatena sp.]